MALLYERTEEEDGQIEIRLATPWYLIRYGVLGIAILFIFVPSLLSGIGGAFLGLLFFTIVGIRLFGFTGARREIAVAMKNDAVEVKGSQWSPGNPLTYRFRALPPAAKQISKPSKS